MFYVECFILLCLVVSGVHTNLISIYFPEQSGMKSIGCSMCKEPRKMPKFLIDHTTSLEPNDCSVSYHHQDLFIYIDNKITCCCAQWSRSVHVSTGASFSLFLPCYLMQRSWKIWGIRCWGASGWALTISKLSKIQTQVPTPFNSRSEHMVKKYTDEYRWEAYFS